MISKRTKSILWMIAMLLCSIICFITKGGILLGVICFLMGSYYAYRVFKKKDSPYQNPLITEMQKKKSEKKSFQDYKKEQYKQSMKEVSDTFDKWNEELDEEDE